MSDQSTTSTPPASTKPASPHDPTLERWRLVRGAVVDVTVLLVVAGLAYTKTVSGDAAVALLAAIAGAGAVHKSAGALSGKGPVVGGTVALLGASLLGRGGDS